MPPTLFTFWQCHGGR